MKNWAIGAVGALFVLAGNANSVFAQAKLINMPAEQVMVSPGGVDLRTGRYNYGQTDVSIGQGENSIGLTRTISSIVPSQTEFSFGNFSHNWDASMKIIRVDRAERARIGGWPSGTDYMAFINYDGRNITFSTSATGVTYGVDSRGPRQYLTFTGTQGTAGVVYTFADTEGNKITFQPLGTVGGLSVTAIYPTKLVRADGTQFDLDYASYTSGGVNLARLKSVKSSRGYGLVLEGSGSLITKVCALNLSQTIMPTNGLCPSGVPTATYSYSGSKLASVTDAGGGLWQFTYGTSGTYNTTAFTKPGQATPWLTNSTLNSASDGLGGVYDAVYAQSFSTGETYSYQYFYAPVQAMSNEIVGGRSTNALGETVSARFGFYRIPQPPCTQFPCPPPVPTQSLPYQQTSGPTQVSGAPTGSVSADYCDPYFTTWCSVTLMQSFTDAAGIKTIPTYDGYENVTQARRIAVPGSGLADIVTSATFDCTYSINCAKPTSMTDAKGAVSNFSYDTTHGGLLTEMKPAANAGAARPLVVKTYAQKYAYVKDGGGSLVPAATPVWVPATDTQCQTVAGSNTPTCDPSAPQMVTTYEYGANGTADNLLARGIAVTADSQTLRTCYGYDASGRKMSETQPAANLSACP